MKRIDREVLSDAILFLDAVGLGALSEPLRIIALEQRARVQYRQSAALRTAIREMALQLRPVGGASEAAELINAVNPLADVWWRLCEAFEAHFAGGGTIAAAAMPAVNFSKWWLHGESNRLASM